MDYNCSLQLGVFPQHRLGYALERKVGPLALLPELLPLIVQ